MRKNTSGQFPESPGNLSGMKENFFVAQFLDPVGGGYTGFQVTGIIDFFGFKTFDSGIFLGMKIWKVFLWAA